MENVYLQPYDPATEHFPISTGPKGVAYSYLTTVGNDNVVGHALDLLHNWLQNVFVATRQRWC